MKCNSSKENGTWHHHSVTCYFFRFNYFFIRTFYLSCFLQFFRFILAAALADSISVPSALPAFKLTLLVSASLLHLPFLLFLLLVLACTAVLFPRTLSKPVPKIKQSGNKLSFTHTNKKFWLVLSKDHFAVMAAVFRGDSTIALSSLMVLDSNKNVKVIKWKFWVGFKILT